jgi:hypothetical protein
MRLLIEDNNHEEADTLLIYNAVLASQRNPHDAELVIFSPDTDVLALVIAHYDLLLRNMSLSMASVVVQVHLICKKALPTFHAFTGADNTGRFAHIGKATWLQVYPEAGGDVINALQMPSDAAEVTEELLSTFAIFVCAAYAPKGIKIASIPELRWHLFCKHMAENDKLPLTLGALKQQIHQVQIQLTVWGQANIKLLSNSFWILCNMASTRTLHLFS